LNYFWIGLKHRSLSQLEKSLLDLGFKLAEICIIENQIPAGNDTGSCQLLVSVIWRVMDSLYHQYGKFGDKVFLKKPSVSVIREANNLARNKPELQCTVPNSLFKGLSFFIFGYYIVHSSGLWPN
jgi:hypothetical protein